MSASECSACSRSSSRRVAALLKQVEQLSVDEVLQLKQAIEHIAESNATIKNVPKLSTRPARDRNDDIALALVRPAPSAAIPSTITPVEVRRG